MIRQLFALLSGEDDRSLSGLSRALAHAYAAPRDHLPVWRSFSLHRAPLVPLSTAAYMHRNDASSQAITTPLPRIAAAPA